MHTHRAEKNNQAFQEESAAEVVLVKSVWEKKQKQKQNFTWDKLSGLRKRAQALKNGSRKVHVPQ